MSSLWIDTVFLLTKWRPMDLPKYLMFVLLLLLVTSCSKDYTDEEPTLPDPVEIDLNEDDVTDFVIDYRYLDIDPLPGGGDFGVIGMIDPGLNNQVLLQREKKSLFLRELDEVREVVEDPLYWKASGFRTTLLTNITNAEGEWQTQWEINADDSHSTYFLGLKIENNGLVELGWIELQIDRGNGQVDIIDKGII